MEFPLRVFVLIFVAIEFLSPSAGFSIVAFTKNITSSGWSDIEERLPAAPYRMPLERQKNILSKVINVDIMVEVAKQILEATDSMTIMKMIESTANATSHVRESFKKLVNCMEDIDVNYDAIRDYATSHKINSYTLERFAETAVSSASYSVKRLTVKIHNLLVPKFGLGLFKAVVDNSGTLNEKIVYQLRQSPQQFFYNIYSRIFLTQMKAYAIIQLSYQLLEIYNQSTFESETDLAKDNFKLRSKMVAEDMRNVLRNLSTHFWGSDSQNYTKGINYLEVTSLGQGYIVNEKILQNGESCYYDCERHEEANIKGYRDDAYFKRQRHCNGALYNCKDLGHNDLYVCPAYGNSDRRYNYIQTIREVMGHKTACRLKIVEPRRDSCPYCVCLCDESGDLSDRYFSLRQAASDTGRNRVVTGVRFAKKNRIIHLQVQQSELLPYGVINSSTLEWVSVDGFQLHDRFVYHKQDYFKLDWKNRAIDLHILQDNDSDTVVTGLRFKTIDSNMPGTLAHLNLEIRVTRFHFESGKLYPVEANKWIDNLSTQFSGTNRRTEIILGAVDVSTRAEKNDIISEGNQYVMFTHTAFDKDAAQTTVPFIDSQDVVSSVPTPLIGAGLYYKGQSGFGGFLGLKILTEEIDLRYLDVPTRADTNTIQEGKHKYLRFTPTSSNADVAQTIVPFLDAQDVTPATPMALRGAGLYYKSAPRYGGFVGLKVLTYDANKHF